jgi:hypothetical protein
MQAIEFTVKIQNGMIQIPEHFWFPNSVWESMKGRSAFRSQQAFPTRGWERVVKIRLFLIKNTPSKRVRQMSF